MIHTLYRLLVDKCNKVVSTVRVRKVGTADSGQQCTDSIIIVVTSVRPNCQIFKFHWTTYQVVPDVKP